MNLPQLMLLAALAAVAVAAVCDLRRYEIPDSLTLVLLGTALVRGLATPGFAWLSHLAAALLMLGLGLLLFGRGWFGGGDVKLLIGLATWTGLGGLAPVGGLPFHGLPLLLTLTAFAGGALAALLLVGRRVLAGRPPERLPPMLRPAGPVPYAVAIAVGTVWWASVSHMLP